MPKNESGYEVISCDECHRALDVKESERTEATLPNGYRYVQVSGFGSLFVACSGKCAAAIRARFKC